MGTQETSVYMWDQKLLLSDLNFEQKLSSHNYDYNAAKGIAFPEDHLLAQFANLAYKNEHYFLPEGWELLTTATNKNKTNGYFGIAVWNSRLHQVVIAHRGTKLSNIGALITDLLLAFNQEKTGQSQSAATFVHLICDAVKQKMSVDGLRLQVSITGHSLGAWLAQITTFTVKYFKRRNNAFVEDENYLLNVHPHTVAFESPGCKEAFVKLVRYFVPHYAQRKYGNYNTLDMTVYLSQLNPINSINEHVGTIYIIRSQTHSIKDVISEFDKDGRIFKERLLDFRSGMAASCKSFFKRLAPCSSTKTLKEFVKENEYSLNVFSERELDFVKDWTHVVNYNFPTVLQFKRKHLLPDFDVDDERNIIKGHTVNTAIACIKHIKPTKTVIYELLQNDKDVKVHYEIFKLKTQQFEKDLLQFRSYYFKDKYRLKEYLKSNDRMLHIQVDRNSTLEYELETSILNSVITYYKNNDSVLAKDYFTQCQYGFMAWKKLYEVLHILPNIFENYKVNLVIIECFEMEDQDKEAILQFLKKSTIKLILLSTNEFCWKEGINDIKEVPGYGDNIQFRDLTEGCQQEFFMQKNLKLYGKEISFYDIISESFPFNNEVYHHLNKAIPIDVLLELMVTPITEPIEMDCSFNNLLKGAIFLELHHEVNFSKLQKLKHNEHLQFIMQSDDSNLLQTVFEEEKIDFKIQNDFVSYCLEHFDKISYLFTIKNSKPFLTTIFNKNFYISRNIIKNKTISSFIFEDVSEDFDEYYVCGNESKFKEYLNKENRERFRFVSSEEKAKERIQNSKAISSHLLKVEDDKITALYSRGNMDQLRNYLVSEETFADEMELTDNEDIIILSGEPGIGKSSTIGMQFLSLQKTHWVFAVPLKHTAFDDLNAEIDFDYIAKFIVKTSGTAEESCIQHLLAYCLKHETNLDVYLLFDAYDEIHSKDARRKFVELINFLKYSSKVKILITTRKYRCKELENGISVFASRFEIFSSETKAVNFLTNFWECQLRLFQDSVNVEDLQHLARTMLQNAEEIFGETISNFIGIPMHLRMIAEVVAPNSSSPEITHMNVLNLYQKYTENRYDIYLKRSGFTCNETMKQWLCEQISTKLYQLAITKLFDVKIKSIELQDVEELNNIGIIQSHFDTSLNYDFLHDSVRDYFISYLLKRWLELHFELSYNDWDIEKFIIIDIFLNPQYKEMRFFLNCYLQNVTVASERLEKCQNRLKQLWEMHPSRFFFDHESAFHVCVKENLCFLMKYFLFQITNHINNIDLLCKRNADLETPLFLALTKVESYSSANITENSLATLFEEINQWSPDDIKRTLLTTLCAYFVRNKHLDMITNYSQNCINIQSIMREIGPQYVRMQEFLEACKLNNLSKLNSIIELYQNDKITRDALLLLTNEHKETCLHVTTEKDVLDKLLKLGADKNAQDHHGMTPLARAIKEGRTEIAVMLIKKGADITTADYMGNSPLNHAAKYNNLEVSKLLLNSKNAGVDIDHPNMFGVTPLMLAAKNGNESIVKYLLDKGANINATDWNGMSPLYHTVKGDCTNLVRILKQKGADINIQDDYEITPLLYSIIKRRWNMATSLLDNGADVNIGSRREEFPLQLLIKMDRPTIIKKILKDVTVAKDGVMHIVREAAKTHMLSEEQNAYISDLQNTKKAKK